MGFRKLGSGKSDEWSHDFPIVPQSQNEISRNKLPVPQEPTLALHPLPPGF